MNGNDERGIVPAFNSSYSTVKIDSLCIKLGIRKEKEDVSKCSHFSIRGYVAGMRERANSSVLPFTELPPMEVPNFRYWRCEKCLQNNNEAANASTETALISVDHYAFSPPAWPHPRQDIYRVPFVPFGEGTSGSRAVDDAMVVDLEADESQTSEELTDRVNVPQEPTRPCITDSTAGKLVINELIDHENSQGNETISQPLEPGQEIDNYQNGHPKRKTRKVRLLKELLCGNTENQQPKNNLPSSPPRIKQKTLHDHDNDNDQHHDDDDRRDPKRSKSSKAVAVPVPETNVTEPSRNPGGREFEESINRYEWNKTGAQRSSVHGRIGSDPMTAWRSIFSDMGRTENRTPLIYSTPRSRATEPYPNFMNSLKSDKRVSASKKIPPSNPTKSKFFVEDSRRMQDDSRASAGTGLGLDLSLNHDPQSNLRSQLSALNRPSNQDFSRKPGFFSAEASNSPPRIQPDSMRLLDRPVSYGGCSGHQKLDFSDPYKRNNTGVGGYSEFTRPNNNNNHQRQENMFSIGRSDEREVIELMARNQFERSLSEANKNGSFRKPMNGQMTPSHPEYLNMIRPSENVSPMRSPPRGFFHQDRVSNFTMNQKKPFNGVWMSDAGPQRRYEYDYDSRYHYALNGNGKRPQTHLYSPNNMKVLEGLNKYNSGAGTRQHEAGGMPFGQAYAKYSEKDKGKNMINLDLNLVAEEQNNFESLDVNRNRMSSFDSSYSNEAIPAMQLLSLMDAGKLSHQPFSLTGQTSVTKPKPRPNSSCFSHGGSTVTERISPFGNPIGTSHTSVLRPSQNANLTASIHGQQVFHGSRGASLAPGGFQPVDSVVFPFPWQASEGRSTIVNRALGSRLDPVNTDVCVLNQNPADISSPGPDNPWMINTEDLVRKGESSRSQIVKRKP
ncbi:uncharacterized protein LOC143534347 [Bidens hawaiensis]|uniref:uncharacterized protein LOC143534347 n=1 Tax=Bidens hawaiensis TaxID=980011 RepID=UPI00404AF572